MTLRPISLIPGFLFSLAMLLSGCQKEVNCARYMGIYGDWIWVESVGGFGGWTLNPESEQRTSSLHFDNYYLEEYVQDSLVRKETYQLGISEDVLLGTEEKTFIAFASGTRQAILISETELVLIDQCFDCFFHRYKRQ